MYGTPQGFFDSLDAEFHFDLDACATAENAKCGRFFTLTENGLLQHWSGSVWCNPPYRHNEIREWVSKAHSSAVMGATVVCLLPSFTDTTGWHDYVSQASEIRFVKGRLSFEGTKGRAFFPSVVVVFKPFCGAFRAPALRSVDSGRNRRRRA